MGPVLIIGANGQLGSDLCRVFADRKPVALTHADLDVRDAERIAELVDSTRPSAVVNTAAYHVTAQCEEQPELSFAVNAVGPLHLARACEKLGSLLIHVSTDYVFDGEKRAPYLENDPASPVNVYGLSKAAGERAVTNACERHYVVRACGLYGIVACRAKGENFPTKMLRLAEEKGEVTVVTDEIVTPTWTHELALQIRQLCETDDVPYGTVHASAEGSCSWYEFAEAIFRLADAKVDLRVASVADFPVGVRRPHYSVLENRVLKRAGANRMRHWRESLADYLDWHLRGVEPRPA